MQYACSHRQQTDGTGCMSAPYSVATGWAKSNDAAFHFYRAALCVSAVFVGVCPSVTLVYYIHTAEHVVKLLSRVGSLIIVVF